MFRFYTVGVRVLQTTPKICEDTCVLKLRQGTTAIVVFLELEDFKDCIDWLHDSAFG